MVIVLWLAQAIVSLLDRASSSSMLYITPMQYIYIYVPIVKNGPGRKLEMVNGKLK